LEEVGLPETGAICRKKGMAGEAMFELIDDEKNGVASLADMLR
jgi:hypothetical protein